MIAPPAPLALERPEEGSRSLREYAGAIGRRRWLVLGLVAAGLAAGFVVGQRTADVYAVSSHIDISKQRPLVGTMGFGEGYMESQLYYPTQYSLLASRTYAERLFRPHATPAGTAFPMWDWLTWPAYAKEAPASDAAESLGRRLDGPVEFEALVGLPAAEFARRFSFRDYPTKGRDPAAAFSTPADLEGFLANRVTVKPEKGTTLVEISVEGAEPRVLAPLLNLLVEVFAREQRTAQQRRFERERDLFEDQRVAIATPGTGEWPRARQAVEDWTREQAIDGPTLEQEKQRLVEALREDERALRETSSRLASARPDVDALVPGRASLEKAAREKARLGAPEAEADTAADEALRAALDAASKEAAALGLETPDDSRFHRLPFVAASPRVADLGAKIEKARVEGASAVVPRLVGERNLAVREAVLALARDVSRDLSVRVEARAQQAKDDAVRRTRWAQAAELAEKQGRLDRAAADLRRVEESLRDVDSRVTVERDLKPLRVIERADDPVRPVRPDRPLWLLLGAGLGLLLGLSLALLLDWIDDTLSDPKDVERHVGAPVLGAILAVPASESASASVDRIAAEQPRSPVTEAFRAVRTALEFAPVEGPGGRVLLVSSCSPREGKTTVAMNLASVLAQDGKRTLLVDADLRKPRLHQVLKVAGLVGLSSVVAGRAKLEDAVVPSGQENLWVLPSGPLPPNPAELLGRPAAAAVFARLRKEYDRVVLDTPPAGVVTDAAVIARHADIVLLVAAAGSTKRRAAEHGARVFRSVGVEPAGVILNHVRRGAHGTYGDYYAGAAAAYHGANGAEGAKDGARPS